MDEQNHRSARIPLRIAKRFGGRAKRLGIPRPLQAIRLKCLDCCCGSAQEVRLCTITTCALHPYRFGRYPKDQGSDDAHD